MVEGARVGRQCSGAKVIISPYCGTKRPWLCTHCVPMFASVTGLINFLGATYVSNSISNLPKKKNKQTISFQSKNTEQFSIGPLHDLVT